MKFKTVILSLLISSVACEEKVDVKPSPCSAETPKLKFKIESTKLVVTWDKIDLPAEADYYNLDIRLASEVDTTKIVTISGGFRVDISATSYEDFNRLMPGNKYRAGVGVIDHEYPPAPLNHCNMKWQSFATPCGPIPFQIGNIKTNSAGLNWSKSDYKLFTVNLRKKGTTDILFNSTDNNSIELTELNSKTEYEVQVVYTCIDSKTYIGEWTSFTTL